MKKFLVFLSVIPFFFLSNCSVGPDFQQTQVDTLDVYRYDSLEVIDTLAVLKWWELFSDPILDTLIRQALDQNRDLRLAAARIEEARANLGFTGADQYPKLDIQAGAIRGNYTNGIQLQSTGNNFFITPVLNWEIDFWGKYRRATESAEAQLFASEYSLRKVQVSLISEVIGTYFLLLDYAQRLEISKRTLESREISLDIIQQRLDQGIVPEIDLNQAQIQREIAKGAVPYYERLLAKTENSLSILIGKNPGIIEKGLPLHAQTIPPEIPVGLPSQLLSRRPDVAEAEFLLMSQNAKIGIAVAQRFPAISLTGVLGLASNDLSSFSDNGAAWSISAGLLGPIFNFNKNIARVEVEEARTKQALNEYELTVQNAFREVEDALIEIRTYREEVAAKQRQFKAADNAAGLSKSRYDQGVTSYLEVQETERSAFNAGLELSATKSQYLSAYVKLYKALGGGWLSKDEFEEAESQAAQEESQN